MLRPHAALGDEECAPAKLSRRAQKRWLGPNIGASAVAARRVMRDYRFCAAGGVNQGRRTSGEEGYPNRPDT